MSELLAALLGAIIGAVGGGAIASHLALRQEQLFAARTILAWIRSLRNELDVYTSFERDHAVDGDPVWSEMSVPSSVLRKDPRIVQSLPEWVAHLVSTTDAMVRELEVFAASRSDSERPPAMDPAQWRKMQARALADFRSDGRMLAVGILDYIAIGERSVAYYVTELADFLPEPARPAWLSHRGRP